MESPFPRHAGELLIDLLNRRTAVRRQKPVPQVCYVPQMGPIQSCDTCMVKVNGELVRACATTVAAGMKVETAGEAVDIAQREAFDRILQNHMLYCTVCDNNNQNCTIHNTTKELDVKHQARPYTPQALREGHVQPLLPLRPRPVHPLRPLRRGLPERAGQRDADHQLGERPSRACCGTAATKIDGSSCVSCGHCVTVCPCNALMEKSMLGEAGYLTDTPAKTRSNDMIDVVKGVEPPIGYGPILALSEIESEMRTKRTKRTKTVCTYCAVGCSFEVWTRDRHILKIEPTHGPANGISTCVKGKFAWGHINSDDRLVEAAAPRRRQLPRDRLGRSPRHHRDRRSSKSKHDHGPDALAFIASSKCTNEESFLMQKLSRAVIGTNNVDNCARYCQNPATMGLQRTVGYGGDSGSISDIEKAGLVIIVGANPAENHPVLATRVKRSHKHRGQRLIVADLRKNEMAERADIFFRPNPSTDAVWISAIAKYIIDSGLAKMDFINQWVNNFDEYKKSLEPFTLEYAETHHRHPRRPRSPPSPTRSPQPTASASSSPWASRSTAAAPIPRPPSPICCWSPATTCGPAPEPILCAATTTCRAPATSAPCPTSSPAIKRSTTPTSAQSSKPTGASRSPPPKASTTTR